MKNKFNHNSDFVHHIKNQFWGLYFLLLSGMGGLERETPEKGFSYT